jgi:hypothetical protein
VGYVVWASFSVAGLQFMDAFLRPVCLDWEKLTRIAEPALGFVLGGAQSLSLIWNDCLIFFYSFSV